VETVSWQEKNDQSPKGHSCSRIAGRSRSVNRWRWCFPLLLATSLALNAAHSQATGPTESQVKAAYLFNFGRFVRWPATVGQNNTLQICILGKNPFGSVLDATVKGETIEGKSVTARAIPTLQEAAGCHILFITVSEESRLNAILSAAKQQRLLTVSDIPRFAERGGMIQFVTQEDRIRFAVNVGPIEEAGLTVSSQLLKVATKVISKSGGRD
jgi:YfiR/HmsC-like